MFMALAVASFFACLVAGFANSLHLAPVSVIMCACYLQFSMCFLKQLFCALHVCGTRLRLRFAQNTATLPKGARSRDSWKSDAG